MAGKTILSDIITKQIKIYTRIVMNANIPVEKVILFGSHVKGTAQIYSDIDLCIVSPAFGNDRFSDRRILSHLTNDETLDIEPHPMSPEELQDPYDPLAHEIRTFGIEIQ